MANLIERPTVVIVDGGRPFGELIHGYPILLAPADATPIRHLCDAYERLQTAVVV